MAGYVMPNWAEKFSDPASARARLAEIEAEIKARGGAGSAPESEARRQSLSWYITALENPNSYAINPDGTVVSKDPNTAQNPNYAGMGFQDTRTITGNDPVTGLPTSSTSTSTGTGDAALDQLGGSAPDASDGNPERIQTRIDWLKRNRPNDPEIAELQKKLAGLGGGTNPGADSGSSTTNGGSPTNGGNPSQGDADLIDEQITNVNTAINASKNVADVESREGIKYANPTNQTGALGDSRTITTDANGNTSVVDRLSGQQQAINTGDEALSIVGRNAALNQLGPGAFQNSYTPETAQRTIGGDLFGADRQRIEDAVFNNLTRNTQRDKAREWQDQEQALADRGIAIDPRDQQYSRAREQLDERYDNLYANARDRATMLGGQELTNAFGMQEQGIANQYSQGWGTRNNQRAEIAALSQLGPGLRTSNFNQFQGVGYDLADPVATSLAQRQLKIDEKTANAALKKLGSSGGTVNTQPASTQPESPFNA